MNIMNERQPPTQATEQAPAEIMVRPAPKRESPDWRRFEVAKRRFGDRIADGITTALEHKRDIDNGTARCIAHVLGRSLGRESALADYGRTGTGYYAELREEYLALHNDEHVTESTQELIDWFGSHLITLNYPDARTITSHRMYPPRLDNILVPTGIEVGDWHTTVNMPGIYGAADIATVTETLAELQLDTEPGFRAFLLLPDVNAASDSIFEDYEDSVVGTWPTMEQAIHELCLIDDREEEVQDFAAERRLYFDYLTPDYEALREDLEEAFDLIEHEGSVYVFHK